MLEVHIDYEITAPWDAVNRVLIVRQNWEDTNNIIKSVSGPPEATDLTFLVMIDDSGCGKAILQPMFRHRLNLKNIRTGNLYKNPYSLKTTEE